MSIPFVSAADKWTVGIPTGAKLLGLQERDDPGRQVVSAARACYRCEHADRLLVLGATGAVLCEQERFISGEAMKI